MRESRAILESPELVEIQAINWINDHPAAALVLCLVVVFLWHAPVIRWFFRPLIRRRIKGD